LGQLCLNVLPVSLNAHRDRVVARAHGRNREWEEAVRELAHHGLEFRLYPFNRRAYVWALPGGSLPTEVVQEATEVTLGDLPAAVLAAGVREAAVVALQDRGFKRLPGSLREPVRLSRRKRNFASKVTAHLPEGVGAFAAMAVQGMPFGDGRDPGPVGLLVDQWIEHALHVGLSDLARAGIEVQGLRVRYAHQDGCSCEGTVVGDAGRIVGGDPDGRVELSGRGAQQRVEACCLEPHANSKLLVQYLASLNGHTEADVRDILAREADEFASPRRRWRALEQVRELLDGFAVFDGVTGKLDPPVRVPPSGRRQRGPVELAPMPEPELNFQYGAPELDGRAAHGLRAHGPYDEHQPRTDELRALVMAPEAFREDAKRLKDALERGVGNIFPGIERRYHLRGFASEIGLFEHTDVGAYRDAAVRAARGDYDIVFPIIRFQDRYARRGENPYLAAKTVLTGSGVASQSVTVEKLRHPESSLQYIADSVGLGAYAKVGNVPFVLHDPGGVNELVLGVGRHDVTDASGVRRQRFGVSVAFRQDGDFLFAGSTTPVSADDDYQERLERFVGETVVRYEHELGAPVERVVVYLFKRTGWREVNAIEAAVAGSKATWALLHVNRDSPLWVVRRDGPHIEPPMRGTVVSLAPDDRLLVTGDARKPTAATHPLRLELDRRSTFRDMNRLVAQAFGLTKTSWRGFHTSHEPSPILFGRLLARKVEELMPYGFDPVQAAARLGTTPWFL
jgi:hypothetical protein